MAVTDGRGLLIIANISIQLLLVHVTSTVVGGGTCADEEWIEGASTTTIQVQL